jgi:membrane protease YdiL (CAAX protease family)
VRALARRHPVATYFAFVYLVPALGYGLLVVPGLLRGQPMRAAQALTLFPIMEVGVFLTGLLLTRAVDGSDGVRALWARVRRARVGAGWYATLLIPPALILLVLSALRAAVSPAFAPGADLLGATFGLGAGFLEETGWMGFAYRKLRPGRSALGAAALLGLLWGLWHMPVVDYLGAAAPHGAYWLPFYLAFIALVAAIRVIIAWLYEATDSLLLPMLLHASSTGFLVVLAPTRVSPPQETLWYAIYAALLWVVALTLTKGVRR